MNNWYLSKSNIHGVGIFSSNSLLPNSFIDIAIDKNKKITFFGSKINHSWNPSTRLIYSPVTKTYDVYTIKNLDSGNEITLDYTFTPDFIVKPQVHWK